MLCFMEVYVPDYFFACAVTFWSHVEVIRQSAETHTASGSFILTCTDTRVVSIFSSQLSRRKCKSKFHRISKYSLNNHKSNILIRYAAVSDLIMTREHKMVWGWPNKMCTLSHTLNHSQCWVWGSWVIVKRYFRSQKHNDWHFYKQKKAPVDTT